MIVSWSTKQLAPPWLVERVTRSCTGPGAISLPVRHQGGRERKREGGGATQPGTAGEGTGLSNLASFPSDDNLTSRRKWQIEAEATLAEERSAKEKRAWRLGKRLRSGGHLCRQQARLG